MLKHIELLELLKIKISYSCIWKCFKLSRQFIERVEKQKLVLLIVHIVHIESLSLLISLSETKILSLHKVSETLFTFNPFFATTCY